MTMSNETQIQATSQWKIDPDHTLIEFSAKHMLTTVKGHFKSARGFIVLDEADPPRSSVEVEIDAVSLDSGVEDRDNHLKSADFLDVEHFPLLTFKSTRIEQEESDRGKVIGDLTIHGVTREVVLDTKFSGVWKNLQGQEVAAFEARTSINRKDFGLTWTRVLETGGFLVGDTIKIEIATECLKSSS